MIMNIFLGLFVLIFIIAFFALWCFVLTEVIPDLVVMLKAEKPKKHGGWIKMSDDVDMVAVVRCKECKWCISDTHGLYCEMLQKYASGLLADVAEDDYCSWGERRA